jgi:branched-chain amino acid transport system ATP-binding protein
MLMVRGLRASYGPHAVLRGLDLQVAPGEIVAVLGRNGSGRSTLARALMGMLTASGQVLWHSEDLLGLPTHEIARRGLGYVPESRDVFPGLSVHHNLLLGLKAGDCESRLAQAYALFPALSGRQRTAAGVLSGGEQQMLSLARALMGQPRLLIADEPCEGLAPQVVQAVGRALADLRDSGAGIVLIEQRLALVQSLADRVIVLGRGESVFEGSVQELQASAALRQQWLEL